QNPRGDQEGFLRTAWTLQVCRSVVLWLILVLVCTLASFSFVRAALPPGSVFADPQFCVVTAIMGFGLILTGLESTTVHASARAFALWPIFFLDLAGRLAPLPIMIVWAVLSPSVWALVGGSLVGGIVRLVTSHLFVPGPRMSLRFDKDDIRKIVHFGKWT